MKKNIHNENATYFADWMEGKITDSELKKLISEAEYIEFQKIQKGLDIATYLNAPLDKTYKHIKEKIDFRSQKKPKTIQLYTKWIASIAAVLLIVFGISQFINNANTLIKTSYGEQKTISLLDGSEVVLNAKSQLAYNKSDWKNKREIKLTGEAYFKVTKGSKFTVVTPNGSISVLGTQFNVNSKSGFLSVICYEGRVKVVENNRTHILKPGDAVNAQKNSSSEWKLADEKPQWLTGINSFREAPLQIVIKELENQYNIQFDSSTIDVNRLFSGSFTNSNLSLALASVFKPMQIKYSKQNNTITLRNVENQ